MPKAVTYIRYSADHQGAGSTIARQRQMIDRWLVEHPDYSESEFSQIDEGRSGYKGEHLKHGLGEILSAIESGKIGEGDVILVESFDRLGRLEPLEMVGVLKEIINKDVRIVTLEDNQDFDKKAATGGALFVLVGKVQQAHEYSKRLSERLKASYAARKSKARNGQSIKVAKAMWLDVDGKLKYPEADMVRYAIDRYKQGIGGRGIVRELRDKYPDVAPKDAASIRRWMSSPALMGAWNSILGVFEPLVTSAEFLELQELRKGRARFGRAEQPHGLSGLVSCALCGSSFNFRRQKPKATIGAPAGSEAYLSKPDIVYANCRSYLKVDGCTNNATWPYEVLLFIFGWTSIDVLRSVSERNVIKAMKAKEIAELEGSIAVTNTMLARAKELYKVSGDDGDLQEFKDLSETKRSLEASLEVMAQRFAEAESQAQAIIERTCDEVSFEEQEGSVTDFHERTKSELASLYGDSERTKTILKQVGYCISINGKVARCDDDSENLEFTLLKRRQQFSCYFVKVRRLEDEHEWIVAVGKDGKQLAKADSEEELVEKLLRRLDK